MCQLVNDIFAHTFKLVLPCVVGTVAGIYGPGATAVR